MYTPQMASPELPAHNQSPRHHSHEPGSSSTDAPLKDIAHQQVRRVLGYQFVYEVRRNGGLSLFEAAYARLRSTYGERDFTAEWNRPEKLAELCNALLPELNATKASQLENTQWLNDLTVCEEKIKSLQIFAQEQIYPSLELILSITHDAFESIQNYASRSSEDPDSKADLALKYIAQAFKEKFPDRAAFEGFARELAKNMDRYDTMVKEAALTAMDDLEATGLISLYGVDRPYSQDDWDSLTLLVATKQREHVAQQEFIRVAAELASRVIYSEQNNF